MKTKTSRNEAYQVKKWATFNVTIILRDFL